MIKVFASEVVVCRGFENRPAIKFSDKGDFVRFRVGMKVYDIQQTLMLQIYLKYDHLAGPPENKKGKKKASC